jgi:hypothetical protein
MKLSADNRFVTFMKLCADKKKSRLKLGIIKTTEIKHLADWKTGIRDRNLSQL